MAKRKTENSVSHGTKQAKESKRATEAKPDQESQGVLESETTKIKISKINDSVDEFTQIECFPRGGSHQLSALEHRDITAQVQNELFNTTTDTTEEIKDDTQIHKSKKLKLQNIHSLSHKNINIGSSLIGIVKQIGQLDISLSLPNRLSGFVSITEISDYLTNLVEQVANDSDDEESDGLVDLNQYFHVGQPIICSVLSLADQKSTKRIDLTIKPTIINQNLALENLQKGVVILFIKFRLSPLLC
jgi:rRNA biogenesis protein RRP5